VAKPKYLAMLDDEYVPEKKPRKVTIKKKPKKKAIPKKTCPKCGTIHTKTGLFCSRSCSNSRTWTEEDKQKKKESAQKYYAKPESIPHRENVTYSNTLRHADEIEDVDIEPYFSSTEHEDYIIDNEGDVWHDANDQN